MAVHTISVFTLLSAILTGIAFISQIIGFATAHWSQYSLSQYSGLWYGCFGRISSNSRHKHETYILCGSLGDISYIADWLKAVRAFEVLGLLALVAVVIVILLKCCVLQEKKLLVIVRLVLQIIAVCCILLGVIIYGAKTPHSGYGYSFILCILASVIALFAGIFSILELRSGSFVS